MGILPDSPPNSQPPCIPWGPWSAWPKRPALPWFSLRSRNKGGRPQWEKPLIAQVALAMGRGRGAWGRAINAVAEQRGQDPDTLKRQIAREKRRFRAHEEWLKTPLDGDGILSGPKE